MASFGKPVPPMIPCATRCGCALWLCCKNERNPVSSRIFKRSRGPFFMDIQSQYAFKWRHFESEIILLCVGWYLRYALSYRDLEAMMAEQGLSVDHTPIY